MTQNGVLFYQRMGMRYCPKMWCCHHAKSPRIMMAFDLDETLFYAKRVEHSVQEHLRYRHLPPEFISHATASGTIKISEENYTFHFLNVSEWQRLFLRLIKNDIPIILITNGYWYKDDTIDRLDSAFNIALPPSTHFFNRVNNKPNDLRYYFPHDHICLLDDKNDHLQFAIKQDIDFIHVKTKAIPMDLNSHIAAAHRWLDVQLSDIRELTYAATRPKQKTN